MKQETAGGFHHDQETRESARRELAGRRGPPPALASIGAAALASDELRNLGKRLIERGEIVEIDGRKRYQEMTEHAGNR